MIKRLAFKLLTGALVILSLNQFNVVYAKDKIVESNILQDILKDEPENSGKMEFYEKSAFNDVEYKKSENIKVITDSGELEFDVNPTIVDGRTLVPMRAIFEAFDLEVEWDNENRIAKGKNNEIEIEIPIDSEKVFVSGKKKSLDVPAQIIKGRTLIPLRFLSETLGYKVIWLGEYNTILISKEDIIKWEYLGFDIRYNNVEYYVKYVNNECTFEVITIGEIPVKEIIKEVEVIKEVIVKEKDLFTIYLSPSNQPLNKYVVGNTNEKIEMESISKRIKEILEDEYECRVIIGEVWGESAEGREIEAKVLDVDVYVALHSNAASNPTASGTIGFYHPADPRSKQLAKNIVTELNAINPTKSNRFEQVVDGMAQFDGYGLGEVRKPGKFGITSVLIETEFHTNPVTTSWMIENTLEIAEAYSRGIVNTFDLDRK